MAEAHQAVHVSGEKIQGSGPLYEPHWYIVRRQLKSRFYRTRRRIKNGLWPTPVWNLIPLVASVWVGMMSRATWLDSPNQKLWGLGAWLCIPLWFPEWLQALLISLVAGVLFFVCLLYVRRYLLRALLAYRGWMYDPPRRPSKTTIAWGMLVRLCSGSKPITLSCQRALPRLPVPPLKATMKRFLKSIAPLYGKDSEQYKKYEKEAQEFMAGLGPKVQAMLVAKSWWAENYVTDWWEKYVYLMSRGSLPINSNYYIMDQCYWIPTPKPAARAATMTYHMMQFYRMLQQESLTPLLLRGTIPLCMAQYERLLGTCRVPGSEVDSLVMSSADHAVVYCRGSMYSVQVMDHRRRPFSAQALQLVFQQIWDDAPSQESRGASGSMGALTGLKRDDWAKIRDDHLSSGLNAQSLHTVQSALLYVVLDNEPLGEDISARARKLLTGDGRSYWFDKSVSLIIGSDGRCGVNCEHSWGDAPVVGHLLEYCYTKEVLHGYYDEAGDCIPDSDPQGPPTAVSPLSRPPAPAPVEWEMCGELAAHLQRAVSFCQQSSSDVELVLREFTQFGKGFMKKCKISPDAFVQQCLQLAYFRDSGGQVALTYESSMTRLYLGGRTETVRSLTHESAAFVRAMQNKSASKEERRKLLLAAADNHQKLYRHAMAGRACDRHLFALYVGSRGLGKDPEFLKEALSLPWTLSTSQQPQQQVADAPDCSLPQYQDKICPGGGFGPVSDDGYGVSYMVPGDHKLFFHVSAKRSVKATDATRLMDNIVFSLLDMQALFE